MPSRRDVLAGSAAAVVAARLAPAAADTVPRRLRVAPVTAQIAPEGYAATELWGVNGTVPGETLRLRQGEPVTVRVDNAVADPISVHWHGLRIANAMDGVPGLTQAPIAPGARFDYSFAPPDAGTFWYHSHVDPVAQVERGLHGALVVAEPAGSAPEVAADHVLVLDDIRLDSEAQVALPFETYHDRSHGGRIGNVVLTNGRRALSLPVEQNARLRLRLINAANARVFRLGLRGLAGWTVALDGMPLEVPEALSAPLWLAPGQRADLIVDVSESPGGEAHLVHLERDGGYSQVAFPVTGRAQTAPMPLPIALPRNPVTPIERLEAAVRVPMRMEGGAMGSMEPAIWQGERRQPDDIAEAGQYWALAGQVGRPAAPLVDLPRGATCVIALDNATAFAHAMHLHGMHFREVLAGGARFGPWRDTLLILPEERREIAFVADNPGDWLFHCHMLSHHAAGMGTWLRVRD